MDPEKKNVWDFPIVTVIVVVLVITGCVDILIDGELSKGYEDLVGKLDIVLAGLAIGRGVAARKPG